ncbi:MAG TPA: hypothetical protein VL426_03640 [Candidatus Binatia bacterium]|nr:hypothetical protein [Candidatus Binatia bacterium]
MNKHNGFWAVSLMTMLALAGCGVQEPGDGGSGGGAGDTTGDRPADDSNGWDNLGRDAGTGGTDTGTTADAPAPDAGSPAADAGSPSADAGAPAPDAGSPTPDAGSPAPDAGSPAPDAGTPAPPSPAPLSSPSALQLRFADAYIGAAACGQVRGNLPGTTWSSGPTMQDTNADHVLEVGYASIPAGNYELSYVSAACPGGPAVAETWASYGSRPQLLGMTGDARSFVNCNWWDAASGMAITVASPGCNLRIAVDGSGNVTGAGNMRNYH